jgi:calcium-dependent protein kinase
MPESDNGDDDNSDATIINENFDIDLEFVYDKDPQELMKSAGILEDIDIYINRIKSKVSQQIKQKISDISKDNASDNTIEIKINNVVPINVGNNLDNESDNNSVINFIKNTKKLNYAATLEKREGIIEKNTSENDFLKAKSMNEKSIPKPEPSKPKDIEQGDGKISENDKINKKNDVKERRKSRINELANNANFQNNPILFKLSKDQMLKISTEAITNHYIILNDLGNGSYGTVKKVKHKISNEERAMKIVKKKSESSINEIEILKKISHPNIISIYEIFEDSKNYYIMSELIEGGELFEEITNRGSFSEIDAAKIMKQLLTSVNYLHNKNIVHRDLKPENIMMINKHSNNFEIKLIDFGTAKSFEKGDKLSKFIGTSYYIAPEVLAENYDEKCDIWSSGIILYILFCGYPPFDGNSNIDIYHSIKYSSPSFTSEEWKDVSKEAIDLIVNMLTKNPSKRLNAEQCLSHKWFKNMEALETDMIQKNKIKFNPLKALKKMTDFVTENKLKQMVIQFISTQFNLKEEEESLKNLFEQFDSNGKGYISIQCFTEVLTKYFGENEAKFFAQKIFSNIDNDGNGEISYNEFITSIMDKKILEKNQRIEKAFKMIDKVFVI